jgi:glycine dehydrogenase
VAHEDSPLAHAPHTADVVMSDEWQRPYTREQAAYPAPWVKDYKFWPAVGRIDNVYGDRNLFCICPPLEEYT